MTQRPSSLRRGLRPVCGNSPSQIDLPIRSAGQITLVNGCVKINNRTLNLYPGTYLQENKVSVYNYITILFLKPLTRACLSPKRVEKKGLRNSPVSKAGVSPAGYDPHWFPIKPNQRINFLFTNNGSCLIPLECMHTLPCFLYAPLPVLLYRNTLVHIPWFGNQYLV